ncbi:ABC transporter permease subunit [Psychrobacillus sp.]|uniref:ABC transporter permease subunit n=1 Tax=Psychrobacillus sp. TaxID=1871623 RepID=UPI0028BF29B1|nr:ABC transporter permease subunit [Psychrobacillus sp.]
MKYVLESVFRFICVVIGLILLSAFVGLFLNGLQLDIGIFVKNIVHITKSLIFSENLVVIGSTGSEYSIFINYWDYYFYSIIIFLAALFTSITIGTVLSYFTIFLPNKINRIIVRTASLLESLPDLFIIIIIQFSVLYYYKQTGTMLFPILSTSQTKPYLLPIIALALIPSLIVFKIILYLVNEELEKPYILLAKNKGFGKSHIFLFHVLRNIVPSIITHSKSVILLQLSTMVIFEKLFNINGIITYLIRFPEPNVIAFTLIMIYVPIFLFYSLASIFVKNKTGQRLEW